jgi:hypothetical protein
MRIVKSWALAHRRDLQRHWERLIAAEPLVRLAPLK